MPRTSITIQKTSFLINGKPTYSEIDGSAENAHGLLMNARFIQGVFDDRTGRDRYARWGKDEFDPDRNTGDLVAALPEWYACGLRAFTVGFQGGGPCFTIDNSTIHNNPFGEDGLNIDPDYAARMDRLIRGADEIGMAVIVSFFYGAQARRLRDGKAVRNAVVAACRFLKEGAYTNVLIEVANEHNIGAFNDHPIIHSAEGMAALMDLAREASGGLAVGCSGGGGYANREICEASDFVLIHGNGCSRQRYDNLIRQAQQWAPDKPIVCNEDSQCIGQLKVAFATRTSWGYYNNMTKQEPPADWRITPGEDTFFARRMAEGIGIDMPPLPEDKHHYLQGLEPHMEYEGKRWIRLASLHPEQIDCVAFYRNGTHVCTAYDEPFMIYYRTTWIQNPWMVRPDDREWRAVIHMCNGDALEKTVRL